MPPPPADILLSELRHVVAELQGLVGCGLKSAWVPRPETIILSFGKRLVHLETYPLARFHTTSHRPKQPKQPYSFQGLLRARARGPLQRLRVMNDDRVIALEFASGTLHARLFGRGGGIWWMEDGVVIAASSGPAPRVLPPLAPRAESEPAPRFGPVDGSWNLGAAHWFSAAEKLAETERWRRHLRGWLRKERKRAKRLTRHLEGDLSQAEGADRLREDADCLAAVLHKVPRGLPGVEVPDLFNPPATRRISLKAGRPASETMRQMYSKARRLEAAVDRILIRLDEAETRLATLEEAATSLPDADLVSLRAITRTLSAPKPGPPKRPTESRSQPFRIWEGPNGERVLAGRNAKTNHQLTFSIARGRDWWFHLRDIPGAHVILRSRRNESVPLETLLAVAQIVLIEARTADGARHDVQYARVSDLRPIKGAGPGQVAVTREKVLHVQRESMLPEGWSRLS